jgi:cytokinesis protein
MAAEKRKLAAEESKANREKVIEVAETEDAAVLDNLLEKLRNGDVVGRRPRRARQSAETRNNLPMPLNLDGSTFEAGETAAIAKDMLAQLHSDGFDTSSYKTTPTTRRRRRRPELGSVDLDTWEESTSTIPESNDEETDSYSNGRSPTPADLTSS